MKLWKQYASSNLIIHNASFELRWFGRHFGFIPKNVFCTLTADRLLIPRKKISHDLEDRSRSPARYCHRQGDRSQSLGRRRPDPSSNSNTRRSTSSTSILSPRFSRRRSTPRTSTGSSDSKRDLLPIVAKMELHGFAVSTGGCKRSKHARTRFASDLEAGDPGRVQRPGA